MQYGFVLSSSTRARDSGSTVSIAICAAFQINVGQCRARGSWQLGSSQPIVHFKLVEGGQAAADLALHCIASSAAGHRHSIARHVALHLQLSCSDAGMPERSEKERGKEGGRGRPR